MAETVALEDGSSYTNFTQANDTTDTIAPKSYLVIITNGLAPAVNLTSLATDASWGVGEKLVLSANGEMKRAERQIDAQLEAISIGKSCWTNRHRDRDDSVVYRY